MSEDKEWWKDEKYSSLHAGDQWCICYDIPAILAEHTQRIVEVLEGMKDPNNGMYHDAVLEKAIAKIKEI